MRALALLSGAVLPAAVLTACDGGATEPPFLLETSPTSTAETTSVPGPTATAVPTPADAIEAPTPLPESGGIEGFRAFAALIEEALAAGDGHLLEQRAAPGFDLWSGDVGTSGTPPEQACASFERLISDSLPEESDEFGEGEARLYALATRARDGAATEPQYLAVATAIVRRTHGYQPSRTVALFEFEFRREHWVLRRLFFDPHWGMSTATLSDYLTGAASYDHWERWEGTP